MLILLLQKIRVSSEEEAEGQEDIRKTPLVLGPHSINEG